MKIYEEGVCYIVDLEDGKMPQPYSKGLGKIRFLELPDGTATVTIEDQFTGETFSAKVTELKNATIVISATGTPATDYAAVRLYLTGFIG